MACGSCSTGDHEHNENVLQRPPALFRHFRVSYVGFKIVSRSERSEELPIRCVTRNGKLGQDKHRSEPAVSHRDQAELGQLKQAAVPYHTASRKRTGKWD